MILVKNLNYDQIWLVKSAGLVLGPFSLIELTSALKDHRVALLDEVRTPDTRWGFIRENRQLAELVRNIRESEAQNGNNTGKTNVDIDGEDTQSASATVRIIDTTPTPVPAQVVMETQDTLTQPAAKKMPIEKPKMAKIVPKPHLPLPQIPVATTQNKRKLFVGFGIAAIILIISTGVIRWMMMAKVEPPAKILPELVTLAKKAKADGFYEKSLMMFDRAMVSGHPDVEIRFEMIPLLLLDAKNYPRAKQYISELMVEKNIPPEIPAKLWNWSGLLLMKQGQFSPAEEKLRAGAERYSQFKTIQTNRIINFYFSGQFESALQLGQVLQSQGAVNPMISIAKAMSMLGQGTEKFSAEASKAVIAELSNWSFQRRDVVFESLLAGAALANRSGDSDQVIIFLDRLVEQSAGITHAYVRSLDLDNSIISWDRLRSVCEGLTKHHANKIKAVVLGIDCLIEEGNLTQAQANLDGALQKYPKDSHLIGLQAAILKIQGHANEVKELLKDINTRPGLLLRGQSCLDQKDLSCAEATVKILMDRDQYDPESIFLLTQLNLIKDKRDLAGQIAEKELDIVRTYKPLLEIREEMGEL